MQDNVDQTMDEIITSAKVSHHEVHRYYQDRLGITITHNEDTDICVYVNFLYNLDYTKDYLIGRVYTKVDIFNNKDFDIAKAELFYLNVDCAIRFAKFINQTYGGRTIYKKIDINEEIISYMSCMAEDAMGFGVSRLEADLCEPIKVSADQLITYDDFTYKVVSQTYTVLNLIRVK